VSAQRGGRGWKGSDAKPLRFGTLVALVRAEMRIHPCLPALAFLVACAPAAAGPSAAAADTSVDVSVADARSDADADIDASACAVDDVSPGTHTYACDGMTHDVTLPPACTTRGACGLVVDVRGWTMDGAMEDANTDMRALGAKYGYVVVQPNAQPGDAGALGAMWESGLDDDRLYRLIEAVIAAVGIDAARVHLMGFSDGGMVTFRFLCQHAEMFASVAPAAAGGTAAQEDGEEGCTFTNGDGPRVPVPVLYMQGTKDPFVSFAEIAVPQRDAMIAWWGMGAGTVVEQGSGFVRTRYDGPGGALLEFLQHDYASAQAVLEGHCYPGSTDPGDAPGQLFSFACTPPDGFTWGDEVMQFFMAHEGR
jgi:poly(3-hydroxybutyrate) depolymerase